MQDRGKGKALLLSLIHIQMCIRDSFNEERTIEETLDLGWRLLSLLPKSELDRVDDQLLKEHYKPETAVELC